MYHHLNMILCWVDIKELRTCHCDQISTKLVALLLVGPLFDNLDEKYVF